MQTEIEFRNDDLLEVYNLAKKEGCKIFTADNKSKIGWFFIVYENEIGYCQENFGGITFSSVHKPNKNVGTGFRVSGDFANPVDYKKSFNIPTWGFKMAKNIDIKKWLNWDEYINARINRILTYKEI